MQPQQEAQPETNLPKIAFADALRGTGADFGASSNPLVAAAADLLILLGRLRTGMVEMQAIPLRDHVLREIGTFVQKSHEAGIAGEDIEVARYALAATADDVVQQLPGPDRAYWQQYPMAAELLNDRSAGIGFFARLDQVMQLSHQRKDVLELMLTCLALGFEGKYRAEANSAIALSRLRQEIYHRFRQAEPRPGSDISLRWTPVVMGGRRRASALPLWIVGGVASAMVVALFATLAWILSTEAKASQDQINALHVGNMAVGIEANNTVGEGGGDYTAGPPEQLERIQGKLAAEIEAGTLVVEADGDFIEIRLREALQFRTASATLSSNFDPLAQRIASVLEVEPGPIKIQGHSDNIRMSGTGRYKTNEQLSEARADTVRGMLAEYLSEPDRMSIEGVGPNQPIDTANTAAARAKNRRVEILLKQENRL
jgi:type VI secretion system protein ImpK